ncbi:MAG: cyclase family protein [Phycisphaeraceae bacterium]|nr:cyclase family protein [Phycisphaerales bacterium]MCB9861156.1 cyclase family protein [Phycisphaeraceae bacterium]
MTESGTIIDISPVINPAMQVFPGDTPPERRVLLDMHDGANITLSTLTTTVHVASHADAESHYVIDGKTIDEMDLSRYLGPCVVVGIDDAKIDRDNLRVGLDAIIGDTLHPRVLIQTGTQPDKQVFNQDFCGLAPELIDALGERGVRTLGVDVPSVDPATSKDLPAHAACARNNIAILEGLVLDAVTPGVYELIALPLKLRGFDGSPVRAVLRTLDQASATDAG